MIASAYTLISLAVDLEIIVDILVSCSADSENSPNVRVQDANAATDVCRASVSDDGMYSLTEALSIR